MLAVVPARGGSKRIPRKNIVEVAGRPLLEYTLEAVSAAGLSPAVVSTDDEGIGLVAERAGWRVIERPPEIATDDATVESAVLHVLDVLEGEGSKFEWVGVFAPTNPLRRSDTIKHFVTEVEARPDAQDCLMSVTRSRPDLWRREDTGRFVRMFPDWPRRQQERPDVYEENSAIYISATGTLRKTRSLLGEVVRAIDIGPIEGLDINTEDDIRIAAALMHLA